MHIAVALWLVFLASSNFAYGQDYRWVRPAIMKLNVLAEQPVLDSEGVDICPKMGTGIIVSSRHIITAAHVVTLKEECGGVRQIQAISVSKRNDGDIWILNERDRSGADVALLEISGEIPLNGCNIRGRCYCALSAQPFDLTNDQKGFFFGIPGTTKKIESREVTISLDGDEYDMNFPAASGHSGGPVLINPGALVGIVSDRITEAAELSRIVPLARIRNLLNRNNIVAEASGLCNSQLTLSYDIAGIKFTEIGNGEDEGVAGIVVEFEQDITSYDEHTLEVLKSLIKSQTGLAVASELSSNNTLTLELEGSWSDIENNIAIGDSYNFSSNSKYFLNENLSKRLESAIDQSVSQPSLEDSLSVPTGAAVTTEKSWTLPFSSSGGDGPDGRIFDFSIPQHSSTFEAPPSK